MPLAAGRSLAFYEILGPLGSGAMGEVYRARDTRLEREVAIKVLPDALAGDEEGLQRFEREARTLACLSHPLVAHVYGIDQVDGTSFMAMELVPGEDLARRLERGAMPPSEALDVCRQVAEGLEAAHEAGVIHRDLKPANVILTPEGGVKLLDFGLAKPIATGVDAGSSTGVELTSAEGRLLGTPGYMSPEQVRSRPTDKRADVWAFGCVLYECLSGRRAFGGETLSDALAAVLEREPDWSALPARTPGYVRALLRRCLEKDSRTRLRDIGEARVALTLGEVAPAVDPVPRRGMPLALTLPLALAAGAAGWLLAGRDAAPARPANPLADTRPRKLIDWPSTEFDADISPAGDMLAFGSNREGRFDLYVAQIDVGEPANLTQGRYPMMDDGIRNLGFDRDGSRVWIFQGQPERLMAAPRSGGEFVPMLDELVASADWTRDGSRLVYHVAEEGDPIHVRAVDGAAGEPILPGWKGLHQHFPTWSWDEEWIFLVRGRETTGSLQLWRVRADGDDLEQLTFSGRHFQVAYPTPIDGSTVLFVAQDADGAGPWLWALDLSSLTTRRAAIGTERYTSIAASGGEPSSRARRLVATQADPGAALWTVPILSGTAREEDAELLPGVPSPRALAPRYAAESGRLFYLSSRGGRDGLWWLEDGRAREAWSGVDEPLLFLPSISPDGRRAAVVRRRGARRVLSILSVESRQTLVEFEEPDDVRGLSSWSPDGRWVVIGGTGPDADGDGVGDPGVFRFPADGGPVQTLLTDGEANDPVWSPAGDRIVYCGPQIGPMLALRAIRPDGTPLELSEEELQVRIEKSIVRFLPDGSGLVYMEQVGSRTDFRILDVETGQTRPLTELEERGAIQAFDVTPDGRSLVFDRVRENSDIVLIELD